MSCLILLDFHIKGTNEQLLGISSYIIGENILSPTFSILKREKNFRKIECGLVFQLLRIYNYIIGISWITLYSNTEGENFEEMKCGSIFNFWEIYSYIMGI